MTLLPQKALATWITLLLLVTVILAGPATAGPSPYVGQSQRRIKVLSPGEIEGYLQGRGMGLAKAAELNHYPGPMHVLELAGELKLSPRQRRETQRFYDEMHRQAVILGKRIVAGEERVEQLFASQKATEPALRAQVLQLGRLQGELRLIHLRADLRMKQLLTPQQIRAYDQLWGYDQHSRHPREDAGH